MTQHKTTPQTRNTTQPKNSAAKPKPGRTQKPARPSAPKRLKKSLYVRIIREITADHTPMHHQIPAIQSPDGKSHFYLNAAVPRNPNTGEPLASITAGICAVCGHAYADLIRKAAKIAQYSPKSPENDPKTPEISLVCDECRGDEWFSRVLDLESKLGVRLDTGTIGGRDLRHEREKYNLKSSQTRQIKHLAEESSSNATHTGRRSRPRTNE